MNATPIRVLFLTRYPLEGASSRYRVFQYLPHLEALNVRCDVQSFMDQRMYRLSLTPGKTILKVLVTLQAVVKRLWALRKWRSYDIIYLQRELFPFGPPWIERMLKSRGAKLFFDYDDALFIKKSSRYNPIATFFRSAGKTRELLRLVDCTIAGNDWLRDAARDEGGTAVTLEAAEDTSRIPMRAHSSDTCSLTIGWLGSPSTVKYLNLIQGPLQRLARRHPGLRWEIMGGNDFAMEGVDWQLHDWSLDGELSALGRYDIGLMPLPPEDWAKGKSGGKARTYMAAGVVPVVAAVGYNLHLIRHGETGFLCSTLDEWEDVIERLLDDPALRRRVASAARREVETHFSPAGQARKLADLFGQVLGNEISRA